MHVPEIDAASVVMVGSFNPTIFQPLWLGAQKLIRAEEAETAKITTIQAELTDFSTAALSGSRCKYFKIGSS
jgi:hypothetical protein